MLELGYALSSEEMPPSDLVRFAQKAEVRRPAPITSICIRWDRIRTTSFGFTKRRYCRNSQQRKRLSLRSGNQRTSLPFEE
jgi:hypothetical protein